MKIQYLLWCKTFSLILLLCACTNHGKDDKSTKDSKKERKQHNSQFGLSQTKKDKPIILFLGNSLTAGYGVEKAQSFPSLIQNKLDSIHANYEVVNAGVSGETTAGGREKIDWYLRNQKPAIFVLELGANDALRGVDPSESYDNLAVIIETVQKKFAKCKILLAGMQAPPNMGDDYARRFRKIYPDLEQKYHIHRIPFLLDIVAGNSALNQPDGIHPTAQGHQILANTVWKYLKTLI